MKRSIAIPAVLLLFLSMACGSMPRTGIDDQTIARDVRAKIAEALPGKPLAVQVDVHKGAVTLSGHAASEEDRRKITDAANSVKGVRTVINNVSLEP